ncbi:MAG TPA: dihydroorotate dehydrogenase electron transfer subunit [Firmicutes bacterium]|nr:dihydroorotate dehydrogenase electron transfer subunit [Bacillota bacterium]
MKNGIYEIVSNRPIALDTYEMVLAGDMGFVENPGQFVNIQLEGLYLRRPISICDWDDRTMTLIYKVVGRGTRQMAAMAPGHKLDLLTGLGNGFSMEEAGEHSLVIGGGVGVPPLYGLCKRLVQQGKRVSAVLGFGKQEQVFYQKEFEELGCPVYLATEDGSMGTKGFVTDVMAQLDYDYYFACGPMPMLRAVHAMGRRGQLSFEERMGCGFGACMGCSCETLVGTKRICVDGPVMRSEEVKF